MRWAGFRLATAALVVLLATPSRASAYSVLAHEAMIDAMWPTHIAPLLEQKFPGTSAGTLRDARAYAYGGSLIQDLGYYPFGSRFFSNLVHYVRSGEFVEALLRQSRNVNEYAFALGALAHYTSDNLGHSIGVNRVVPIIYPKLKTKHGAEVLYADSPTRHVMVEFSFDVLEVARGAFKSDVYEDLIGFEVATPVLERAFHDTYGFELRDVFGNTDLAIGTYRHAVSKTIPDITRLAWREKRDEILAATPGLSERDVVYTLTERQYRTTYGTTYRKPGFLARFVVLIFKIVPKFGPFKPLAFEPLTPETDRMFVESFTAARDRYRMALTALRSRQLTLEDTDLDTGHKPVAGINALADETYADLLAELAERQFTGVSPELRGNINGYYASRRTPQATSRKLRKQEERAARHLASLNAVARPD
jgi:hypothetical protein